MLKKDERRMPKYETPIVVALGGMAQGVGYCAAGSNPAEGYCTAGYFAPTACTDAGTAAPAACTAGGGGPG